jgi:hypothetical protein
MCIIGVNDFAELAIGRADEAEGTASFARGADDLVIIVYLLGKSARRVRTVIRRDDLNGDCVGLNGDAHAKCSEQYCKIFLSHNFLEVGGFSECRLKRICFQMPQSISNFINAMRQPQAHCLLWHFREQRVDLAFFFVGQGPVFTDAQSFFRNAKYRPIARHKFSGPAKAFLFRCSKKAWLHYAGAKLLRGRPLGLRFSPGLVSNLHRSTAKRAMAAAPSIPTTSLLVSLIVSVTRASHRYFTRRKWAE